MSIESLGETRFASDMKKLEKYYQEHGHKQVPCNYKLPGDESFGQRIKGYRRKLRMYEEGSQLGLTREQHKYLKESGFVGNNYQHHRPLEPDTVAVATVLRKIKKFKSMNNDSTNVLNPEANWDGFEEKDEKLLKKSYKHVMNMKRMGIERIQALKELGINWSVPSEPGQTLVDRNTSAPPMADPNYGQNTMANEDYKKKIMSMTVKELKVERRRRGIPEKGVYLKNDIQNQLLNYQTDC